MVYEECSHSYRAFNENGELITMACDQWNCEQCARALAWRWAERVRYGLALDTFHDAYFWTLTLPGWVEYPRTGFRLLPDLWDRFRRQIQRQVDTWRYAAFVECHPHRNLIPHFHIISLAACPGRLNDVAAHTGWGYKTWDRQITSNQAAGYVSKYASKQGYVMPRGFRRIRLSVGWPHLPKPLYPLHVYPKLPKESVKAYVRRIAIMTDTEYGILMSRWLS